MNEQEVTHTTESEQQNIDQVEQPPPPTSHSKLIIGIVVVFVLIVAGAAGAYFFMTQQSDTKINWIPSIIEIKDRKAEEVRSIIGGEQKSNTESKIDPVVKDGDKSITQPDWLTYRNKNIGFEFQYPEDVSIEYKEVTNEKGEVLFRERYVKLERYDSPPLFLFITLPDDNFDEFSGGAPSVYLIEKHNITLGNIVAEKYFRFGHQGLPGPGQSKLAYSFDDGYSFESWWEGYYNYSFLDEESIEAFVSTELFMEQILSTFKFIK